MHRKTPLRAIATDPEACSPQERLRILGRLPFFAGVPAAQITGINRQFQDLAFAPGETIYLEGNPASRLFVAATGRVKLVRAAASGQAVLLDILGKGDYFGSLPALGGSRYRETALALTGCCILAASEGDFQSILAGSPQTALNVLGLVAGRLQAAEDAVHQLSAYPLENRLAAVLLRLGAKFGEKAPGGLLIQVPLSRQDLAGMTGATPEAVSRILSRFRQDGWIASGRQWIALCNLDALHRLVDAM